MSLLKNLPREILKEITAKGHTIAHIVAITQVKALKRACGFDYFLKAKKVSIHVGKDYERAVIKATGDTGFKKGALPWGRKVAPNLVEHKGQLYFQCYVDFAPQLEIYYDPQGNGYSREQLVAMGWLSDKPDNAVSFRAYNEQSIHYMAIRGKVFNKLGDKLYKELFGS